MKILVIGESCKDVFRYFTCKRLSPEAPVAVLNPLNEISNPGMASNVKANLDSLGALTDIITNKNWESIKKIRIVDDNSNHVFCRIDENDDTYGTISDHYGKDWHKKIKWGDYNAVVISDYNKSFLSYKDILTISKSHSCVFIDTKKIITGQYFNFVKFIKININEFNKSKDHLPTMGVIDLTPKFIITSGKKGASYLDQVFPVEEVAVKDSAGCGDSFLSGLVFKFVETKDIAESIKFANYCGTKVAQERGVTSV